LLPFLIHSKEGQLKLPPHLYLPKGFVVALLFACSAFTGTVLAQPARGSNEPPKVYWVEKITPDGKLILHEYGVSSTQALEFPDLEIWKEKLGETDPFSLYLGSIPDFRLKLLESGLARLKDEASASTKYVEAQNSARAAGYGMWPRPQPSTRPSPIAKLTPTPLQAIPTPSVEPTAVPIGEIVASWPWRFIAKIVLVALGLIGLPAIGKVFLLWRRRHLVYLVFVGLKSTGKSWLWNRISDPDIN